MFDFNLQMSTYYIIRKFPWIWSARVGYVVKVYKQVAWSAELFIGCLTVQFGLSDYKVDKVN